MCGRGRGLHTGVELGLTLDDGYDRGLGLSLGRRHRRSSGHFLQLRYWPGQVVHVVMWSRIPERSLSFQWGMLVKDNGFRMLGEYSRLEYVVGLI